MNKLFNMKSIFLLKVKSFKNKILNKNQKYQSMKKNSKKKENKLTFINEIKLNTLITGVLIYS